MGRLVSVVLVCWNSAPFLPRCLATLAAQTHRELELVAVDNASADGSVATVESAFPAARVIRNPDNRGFSRAVNQAVALARGDFVLLLNPDVALSPSYVERLVAALDEAGPAFGSATGKLMKGEGEAISPTDRVDSKGIRMTRSGRHLDVGQGRRDGEDMRGLVPLDTPSGQLLEVFGVSGAAAMLRRELIADVAIGGELLDEDFFAYREDADLAWRARLFGWRSLYAPAAVAWHVRTVTPSRRRHLAPEINMHSVKNRFLLRLKNQSTHLALRNLPFEIGRDLVALGALLTIERSSLPALTWLWRNRARILERRRAIQERRRVPDRELSRWFR